MDHGLISINWTAQPLTGEQLLVLRNVAVLFLRRGGKSDKVNFAHFQCEGRLTLKKEGIFVTMRGKFFHADLGIVHGERWTIDFLLPHGSENMTIGKDSHITLGRQIRPNVIRNAGRIKTELTVTTEAALLD